MVNRRLFRRWRRNGVHCRRASFLGLLPLACRSSFSSTTSYVAFLFFSFLCFCSSILLCFCRPAASFPSAASTPPSPTSMQICVMVIGHTVRLHVDADSPSLGPLLCYRCDYTRSHHLCLKWRQTGATHDTLHKAASPRLFFSRDVIFRSIIFHFCGVVGHFSTR